MLKIAVNVLLASAGSLIEGHDGVDDAFVVDRDSPGVDDSCSQLGIEKTRLALL